MRITKIICVSVTELGLCACVKDYSLAPPPGGQMVEAKVKVPKELIPKVVEVVYRSSKCKRIRYGASGQRVELDGFHAIDLSLQLEARNGIYRVAIPKDGGGKCEWKLSNIAFGVAYPEPNSFGAGVGYGVGGGVVVKFDDNRAARSAGYATEVAGDLIIKKDYYPRLSERYIGGFRRTINLLGEGSAYVVYKAVTASAVYFEPILHSDYVVKTIGPKVQKYRDYPDVLYPDGSFEPDRPWGPDFRKLRAIRLSAEGRK